MPEAQHRHLEFADPRLANLLFGAQGRNLRRLEELSGLRIHSRGTSLTLTGDALGQSLAGSLLMQFYALLQEGTPVDATDFEHAYRMLHQDAAVDLREIFRDVFVPPGSCRSIAPKTMNQRAYVAALRESPLVFGVGPAGTGKTYLAVSTALSLLLTKKVKRIVLSRPAVEAGERLGFLPGDLAQKVNPYLRPLYDALHDMLDMERVSEMVDSGVIDIAPLAFMRGRTLNDAFVILDEAQNTTPEQMKMFLTRLGFGSRMAVTGDITQIDLPVVGGAPRSGLVHALKVLEGVEGIRRVYFQKEDIIRHPLVGRIIEAYDAEKNIS
ncbi:MAG: PhoH family protein [Deltaproteobacteria bacterium]|jgi:phosphate starvation-inducible PhoH-like protein|nr:PhoH family protein [Deltaproteobacteria bacterium]